MGTLPLRDGLTSQLTRQLRQRQTDGDRPPRCRLAAASAVYRQHGGCRFRQAELLPTRGDTLTATVPVTDGWGEAAPDLSGKTLSLVLADSGQAQESQIAVAAGSCRAGAGGLGWVLLMALAGGLILNVMPCVLPVLAMKLGSLVQTEGRERGAVRRQFLASVFGIVVSFPALALMMTALRLGNQALGWGIQFQNPWFIGAMALVMVLFSASLLGAVRNPPLLQRQHLPRHPRRQHGLIGHFWQGAFATLLATPCTAPFLGTAVSVALVAPLPLLWGIFFAMGDRR
ncbi:hypothetical protein LNQ03_22375 [Klebsiella pneumoniae subsp. pneumoniae]|nr:hypothetical protein [Klebsiella pneumoniae subsp. pneumoniae]